MAAVGFAGRYVLRQMPNASSKFAEAVKNFPKFDTESLANSSYYKGGFESKMTKREASLILGVSPTATKAKVCKTYHLRMQIYTNALLLPIANLSTYYLRCIMSVI